MDTPKEIIKIWYDRVAISQRGHYLAALHFTRINYFFGIPVIALSTIVGTSVFASLQDQPALWLQIIIGMLSMVAAVLASLQTFLSYGSRAEKHRIAGAKYGALGRQLEAMQAFTFTEDGLTAIKQELDALALDSPNVPLKLHYKAKLPPANTMGSVN